MSPAGTRERSGPLDEDGAHWLLRPRPGVTMLPAGHGETAVIRHPWGALGVHAADPAVRHLLTSVTTGPLHISGLTDPYHRLPAWSRPLLQRSLFVHGEPLFTAVPVTDAAVRPRTPACPPGAVIRLSRYAALRRGPDGMEFTSPLSEARIHLHGPVALAALADLAAPRLLQDPDPARAALLRVLAVHGLLDHRPHSAHVFVEDTPPLADWEEHDLHAHVRGREGWHDHPAGAIPDPAAAEAPPTPAASPSAPPLDLPRTALSPGPPLTAALAARASVRVFSGAPTLDALGTLLHTVLAATPRPGGGPPRRPYSSAGAAYAVRLHLLCDGTPLPAGAYRYDPHHHTLTHRPVPGLHRLLDRASAAAGVTRRPPVLLVLTTRMRDLSRRYRSICYRLALQEAGGIAQLLELTAPAAGLGTCQTALAHGGDTDAALGLDPLVETSVTALLLGAPE
ncbi:SagB/ThcOx family dehydrogenase [Streptomyces sp. NPDC020096]